MEAAAAAAVPACDDDTCVQRSIPCSAYKGILYSMETVTAMMSVWTELELNEYSSICACVIKHDSAIKTHPSPYSVRTYGPGIATNGSKSALLRAMLWNDSCTHVV